MNPGVDVLLKPNEWRTNTGHCEQNPLQKIKSVLRKYCNKAIKIPISSGTFQKLMENLLSNLVSPLFAMLCNLIFPVSDAKEAIIS